MCIHPLRQRDSDSHGPPWAVEASFSVSSRKALRILASRSAVDRTKCGRLGGGTGHIQSLERLHRELRAILDYYRLLR